MVTQLFQPVYPQSALLRDAIYCFYTYQSDSADFQHTHYALPSTCNALTIYESAEVTCDKNNLTANSSPGAAPVCILQGQRVAPLRVELNGRFKRITIIFNPLGLNQFINEPLSTLMGESPSVFNRWESDKFTSCLANLFCGDNLPERLFHLEQFLCSRYQNTVSLQLKKALHRLENAGQQATMDEIAAQAGLSLRSFNRLFRLHLGISPVAHRRIARFRQTLEQRLVTVTGSTLSQLSYQHDFFDPSAFVKLYKQLSGSSPTNLFAGLQRVGDSRLFFQFG